MAKRVAKSAGSIYQLKVTLKYIQPPIWRRIQVPSGITLADLHDILQIVMGWENDHLHEFSIGRRRFEAPMEDFGFGLLFGDPGGSDSPPELPEPAGPPLDFLAYDMDDEDEDESAVILKDVLKRSRQKMRYQYDFGDSWDHEILLEKILQPEPGAAYPTCLEGERACPPEDVGGVWGYAEFLEAQADPSHPRHEDFAEWFSEPFDPERFNLAAINRKLKPRRR
jgi:hypothetical protein